MENIKITTDNYMAVIGDMAQNVGTARSNTYFFSTTEINESTIRQAAWDSGIVLKFAPLDGFISTFTYSQILN